MKSNRMSKSKVVAIATLTHLLVIPLLVQVTYASDPGNMLDNTTRRTLTDGSSETRLETSSPNPLNHCKSFCSNNRPSPKGKYPFPAFTIKCPKATHDNTPECREKCDTHCPSWCTDTELHCPVEEAPTFFTGEKTLYLFLFLGIPLLCCCGCFALCVYVSAKLTPGPGNRFRIRYNRGTPVVQPEPVAAMSPTPNTTQPQSSPANQNPMEPSLTTT